MIINSKVNTELHPVLPVYITPNEVAQNNRFTEHQQNSTYSLTTRAGVSADYFPRKRLYVVINYPGQAFSMF